MKNKKLIIVYGYARGGTNIVWNILQSNPNITATDFEVGQIFRNSWIFKFLGCSNSEIISGLDRIFIDNILYLHKKNGFGIRDNRYKFKDTLYSFREYMDCDLCIKSTGDNLKFIRRIIRTYPTIYFVGLARNGYALAESYIRRGKTAEEAGAIYSSIAERMKIISTELERFRIIRYEDAISEPFAISEELYNFTDQSTVRLKNLRIKSKKFINNFGKHTKNFGDEGSKYWFDRNSIDDLIDKNIDRIQMDRLDTGDIAKFNKTGKFGLEYFGYQTL